MPQTLLITGAAGRIGTTLTAHLDTVAADRYSLRLADMRTPNERILPLDITDFASCRAACEGADLVLHLAGNSSPYALFDALLPVNIIGVHNIFRAAKDAGVHRVVFASSVHAVDGYPPDMQIRTDMPVRPKDLYGVSKAFAEAMGAYFAYQEGMEAVGVRIGAFQSGERWTRPSAREMGIWAKPSDICALLLCCLNADLGGDPFAIVQGISDNRFKRLDLSDTKARLGYAPQADAFAVWGFGPSEQSRPAK